MGTDMIAKATDTFERKQRRCLDLLDEPNLFTGAPQLSIAVIATPGNGQVFAVEDEVRLTLLDDRLLVIRGVTVVGYVENPPSSVVDLMRGPCPSVNGRIVSVFSMTNKAEILLE